MAVAVVVAVAAAVDRRLSDAWVHGGVMNPMQKRF
jgi:hypothetical protein